MDVDEGIITLLVDFIKDGIGKDVAAGALSNAAPAYVVLFCIIPAGAVPFLLLFLSIIELILLLLLLIISSLMYASVLSLSFCCF